MTREVPLTQGLVTLVDDEDFAFASQWKWHAHKSHRGGFYARRTPFVNGQTVRVLLHREIIVAPAGVPVDHANGDGLDNRRANLRLCDASQNAANAARAPNSFGYRGVKYHPVRREWIAVIQVRGRRIERYANCRLQAAERYDDLAREHHGAFARLNFPPVT